MATGYNYSVRQGLNKMGVDNSRIGYDPKMGVTVDGRSFIMPDKVHGNTSFTNEQNFNSAWGRFNQQQQPTAPKPNGQYNVGVRDQMSSYGYDPSKIGYNNQTGYVTYNGQNWGQGQNTGGMVYQTPQQFGESNRNWNINQNMQNIQSWQQPDNPYTQQIQDRS